MSTRGIDEQITIRQSQESTLLTKKHQYVENIQSALLTLSHLTSTVADMDELFISLSPLIKSIFQTDNFHITTVNSAKQLQLSYCQNNIDHELIKNSEKSYWQESLTQVVFDNNEPLHCDKNQRETLLNSGIINSSDSTSTDWLGAPIKNNDYSIGVIVIQSYNEQLLFDKQSKTLLIFVAEHISSTIVRLSIKKDQLLATQQLEKLVNERTQALQAANLKLQMQIDERGKIQEQLYYQAHHDTLTKLPNRAVLLDRLSYSVKHLKRHPDYKFAVLFIDLDRFKIINDTLGHHAGDLFLIEIANRLRKCVRDNDILARLGGDEFVILLDAVQSPQSVEHVAARVIEIIEKPYNVLNNTLHSNASIGIALSNSQYQDANEILRDADAAMYQAKSMGRGRYIFFDVRMREKLIAIMTLEQELHVAIKENQFELHYQEISNLKAKTILGFEALLRWQHPNKGLLTPSEFLFLAEETGIILEIEKWLIEEVSQQLNHWQDSNKYRHAFIAINLSGRHLTQAKQLTSLINLIKAQPIEPQQLILEFNENSFSQNPDLALKNLHKLKSFGVRLALDDYASGLSSFNFLHRYPFEFIKLDRSFIRTLQNSDKNLSLVKALHELGEQFGYRLVAEGIETEETLQQLNSVGCEFGQGYLISRPEKIHNTKKMKQIKHCA